MKAVKIQRQHLIMAGFRNADVKDVNALLELARKETKDCSIQFVDSRMIAGFDHLYFAVFNALKSFETGMNISKSLSVEILLYISGQNQITKALELLGLKRGLNQIAILIIANTRQKAGKVLKQISDLLQAEECDQVIDLTDEKIPVIKSTFGIKDSEIEATLRKSEKEALTNLLIERSALLPTQT